VDFGRLLSMCLTGEDDTDESCVVVLVVVVEELELEELVGFQARLSAFSLNSYRMQIEPFSPIL